MIKRSIVSQLYFLKELLPKHHVKDFIRSFIHSLHLWETQYQLGLQKWRNVVEERNEKVFLHDRVENMIIFTPTNSKFWIFKLGLSLLGINDGKVKKRKRIGIRIIQSSPLNLNNHTSGYTFMILLQVLVHSF